MPQPIFMNLDTYVRACHLRPSQRRASYITPISNTSVASSQILFFNWIHCAYILKFSLSSSYQIDRLQGKEIRRLVFPRTSYFPPVCTEIGILLHILNLTGVIFNENPMSRSRVVLCVQTDRKTEGRTDERKNGVIITGSPCGRERFLNFQVQ
jgi:hypothetical protein